MANTSAWPTCTSDGTATHCTFTLRVTGLNDSVAQPTIPATPVAAAAPSEGRGTTFGCTAGKPGAPFDPVLPGMALMAMAGLWARKRFAKA
ncbi:JDVT-CTERM domain-containing protein [Marinobacter santoriniensis]|uniref:JDVT-CTERM domain-containing protein n=1 Tax=Marinobacter santoriniensis TaxID=523742 RepID=UPI002227724F|nr:JDVT-CTERM domain-containing protein [Marinobacter santoriniensis]